MLRICLISSALIFLGGTATAQMTASFENLVVPASGYQNGATMAPAGSFQSGGASFNNYYSTQFGEFWSGWSYSNVSNATTAGFGNQYAPYAPATGAGSGHNSATYAIANNFSVGDATVALPAGHRPDSMQVTNTTYAALSMLNGDQFAKKFGGATGNDADFFLLTVIGQNALGNSTGSVPVYLADYRFEDNKLDYILKDWTKVDLTSLGADTTLLTFSLTSSDNGAFGMNTPSYFAADDLIFMPVPEPASLGLLVAGIAMFAGRRRTKRALASRLQSWRATPRKWVV